MKEFIASLDTTTLIGLCACAFCLLIIFAIVVLVWLLERRVLRTDPLVSACDPYAEPFGDQGRPPQ